MKNIHEIALSINEVSDPHERLKAISAALLEAFHRGERTARETFAAHAAYTPDRAKAAITNIVDSVAKNAMRAGRIDEREHANKESN